MHEQTRCLGVRHAQSYAGLARFFRVAPTLFVLTVGRPVCSEPRLLIFQPTPMKRKIRWGWGVVPTGNTLKTDWLQVLLVHLHFAQHLKRKQGRRLTPTRLAMADKKTHFPVTGILEVNSLSLSLSHTRTQTHLYSPHLRWKLYWFHSRWSNSARSTVNPLGAGCMPSRGPAATAPFVPPAVFVQKLAGCVWQKVPVRCFSTVLLQKGDRRCV